MRFMLALCFLLTACVPVTRFVPGQFSTCAPSATIPPTPKSPRTGLSIAEWANDTHDALLEANAARDDCAEKLRLLNAYITGYD